MNNFSLDALTLIANECNRANKSLYNNYILGHLGGAEVPKIEDDVLTMIEICNNFERSHETDRFETGTDIMYVGDDAFPDSQQHNKWQFSQIYNQPKQEYDITRAQNAFKRALRARCAGA